ncbi:hypothetical protein ACFV0L_10100 [Streptosporangium canum]|uniref:hypothetical protein n=1 Tax=Streptosporangium canum TaxID=324952 RepID=UPI0036C8A726
MRDLEGWGGELVELAWELNDLGFDSVVRLAPGRRPSVEIFVPPGARVTTTQWGRTSVFTWDRRPSRLSRDRRGCDQQGGSRMREAAERLIEVVR